jgi:hypothetical protein
MGYLYYLNGFGIFTMVPTWGVGSTQGKSIVPSGGELKTK